jgi:hypothetical protein
LLPLPGGGEDADEARRKAQREWAVRCANTVEIDRTAIARLFVKHKDTLRQGGLRSVEAIESRLEPLLALKVRRCSLKLH